MIADSEEASHGFHALSLHFTKIWWRLEALYERWKRSMAEGYEDPYEEGRHPFHNQDLADLVRLASKLGMHYQEGNRSDNDGLGKVVVGVGIVLIATFVIGGWVLSNQVSSLSATVMAGFGEYNRRFAEQNDRIRELEKRGERNDRS